MNSYQGILIHPEVPEGRLAGEITISTAALLFQSDLCSYQISLDQLKITAGGASNRFIFFSKPDKPEVSIYSSDKTILKNPILSSNKAFIQQIKSSKRTLNSTLKGFLIFLAIFGLLITSLYLLKDKMVETVAKQVPISWEEKAGDKLFTALSLQYQFIKNDALKKEFTQVAQPLFNQIKQEGYQVDLYFIKDSSINAFALPGGKVVIQTGLIENAKSWEEVMGVLGHELSHVTKRHHLRGIINNLGLYAILSASFGDVSAIAGAVMAGGELSMLANSRDFEREADDAALNYLRKAKMNPAGLISFFEVLDQQEKTKLDSIVGKSSDLSFLSSHPDTQSRILSLKEKQKHDKQQYKALPDNFASFKAKLSQQAHQP